MRIAVLVLVLMLGLPQLAQAQYGNPEAGYTAPPGTEPAAAPAQGPVAPASAAGTSGIRLAMQTRFLVINIIGGADAGFPLAVQATPGLRLADNRLFIGPGVGWLKANNSGGHVYTIAPTATYDIIQRTNAALHAVVMLNMSDQTGGDLLFGMNFGLGIRALLGESFGIGTEWGFAFTQIDHGPMEPDAVFGFFGALVLESSIGL